MEHLYFKDLCKKITAPDGSTKPITQDYIDTIKVSDLMKIEKVIHELIQVNVGK